MLCFLSQNKQIKPKSELVNLGFHGDLGYMKMKDIKMYWDDGDFKNSSSNLEGGNIQKEWHPCKQSCCLPIWYNILEKRALWEFNRVLFCFDTDDWTQHIPFFIFHIRSIYWPIPFRVTCSYRDCTALKGQKKHSFSIFLFI